MTAVSILAGGVAGFVAFLLAQGFSNIQASTGRDGIFNLFGTDKDGKPFSVKIQNPALKSPQYGLQNISTTVLKRPNEGDAQLEFANEGSGIKKIFTIGIIPTDANTKTNGIMEIRLNEAKLFPIGTPVGGMFAGVSSINIPIPPNFGLKIEESKKLEFLIWNGIAGTSNFTVSVFLANEG